VTCDDHTIGATTALWLAELLDGRGKLVLLPGLAEAEPAQRRLVGARSIFARFPGIETLATEWTSWSGAKAQRIMKACLETFGDRIEGVWCDSGLQAVGSLKAFVQSKRYAARIPPHTGGDLNLAYKLAIRHKAPLAAVDYPPAMGLRAVEVLLDILRGRDAPRRVDVATETVITRRHATASIRPDIWAEEHVRWDLPDDLILASGLGLSYDPRKFRIRYRGNRYNRSAAAQIGPA
jgi:ABC-type sugar transport system substrate-binding protein